MKKQEDEHAIECYPNYGPIFGDDMVIDDECCIEDSCWIKNDGTNAFKCHSEYKKSLFVNTAGPDERNKFRVLDYEVFGIDFESRENINKLCKHPDIIWKCIKTKDISEESLKQFVNDRELLNDLDAIHCEDSNIRRKISRYYFKNPSEFLADTIIVNQQYDSYLKNWLGNDYQWKLIYRASEHGYTAKSFHECCDDVKGPTLIVIKSREGWIFGGYTTQSWKVTHKNEYGMCIYYVMINNQ